MIQTLNEGLRKLSGNATGTWINNEDNLSQWFLSIEAVLNTPLVWHAVHDVIDDKRTNVSKSNSNFETKLWC